MHCDASPEYLQWGYRHGMLSHAPLRAIFHVTFPARCTPCSTPCLGVVHIARYFCWLGTAHRIARAPLMHHFVQFSRGFSCNFSRGFPQLLEQFPTYPMCCLVVAGRELWYCVHTSALRGSHLLMARCARHSAYVPALVKRATRHVLSYTLFACLFLQLFGQMFTCSCAA